MIICLGSALKNPQASAAPRLTQCHGNSEALNLGKILLLHQTPLRSNQLI